MGLARVEHMFDKLAGLDEVELLVAMSEAQRDERRAVARRLVAAGRLCQRRIADSGEDEQQWCIDNWEEVAAEVGAELGVSRGRASAQMEYGKNLLERFPKLAQVPIQPHRPRRHVHRGRRRLVMPTRCNSKHTRQKGRAAAPPTEDADEHPQGQGSSHATPSGE